MLPPDIGDIKACQLGTVMVYEGARTHDLSVTSPMLYLCATTSLHELSLLFIYKYNSIIGDAPACNEMLEVLTQLAIGENRGYISSGYL